MNVDQARHQGTTNNDHKHTHGTKHTNNNAAVAASEFGMVLTNTETLLLNTSKSKRSYADTEDQYNDLDGGKVKGDMYGAGGKAAQTPTIKRQKIDEDVENW